MPNHWATILKRKCRNRVRISTIKIFMSDNSSPKLMLSRAPSPIKFSSQCLTIQEGWSKTKTTLLFRPINTYPIEKAPFSTTQITNPKEFLRKSIKILEKINRSNLNHASISRKSLDNRLKKSNPGSSRKPSMSPMIYLILKLCNQILLENSGLPRNSNRNAKISQRKWPNLKPQDTNNPLLNRIRSVKKVNGRFVLINFLAWSCQINVQIMSKGFHFLNPSKTWKSRIINKLNMGKRR